MSVASLNLYHHGKHHIHPVPKWIAQLFFIIIPKLLFMKIELPPHWNKRRESLLKCMVKITKKCFSLYIYSSRQRERQQYPQNI